MNLVLLTWLPKPKPKPKLKLQYILFDLKLSRIESIRAGHESAMVAHNALAPSVVGYNTVLDGTK